ncbi:MAG: PAS domain-containing protein, partial [Deltaproteobacteria bacterium]|nr:PAS domain-containing protein [Deltaproteobacteria bacterium]
MGSLKILAVCVQDNDLHTLRALLGKKAAYTLETSDSPAEALTLAAGLKPDTIVLDPEAAGSRWISLAKKLAATAPPSTTPLLLLFPVAAAETFQLNGLQKLPCSMLTKPVQSELLESQLNILQRLKKTEDRLQKKQAALTKEHQKKTRPLTAKLERYQRITAALTDYIFTVHFEKGRPVEAVHSPGCESVTGYSSEEFINDPSLWLRIMHPEDRQAVREHVSHVLSSTQAPPLEHR